MDLWSPSYGFFCCLSMLGRLIGRSLGRSIARSIGRSLGRSLARSGARSFDRSLARSVARSLRRSLDRSIARSAARAIALSIEINRTVNQSIVRIPNVRLLRQMLALLTSECGGSIFFRTWSSLSQIEVRLACVRASLTSFTIHFTAVIHRHTDRSQAFAHPAGRAAALTAVPHGRTPLVYPSP